jgi:hypothetical protein
MGGGKERKMNGGSATANQVKNGEKRLKQKFFQTERAITNFLRKKKYFISSKSSTTGLYKIFYQKISPPNLMLNI